MLTVCCSRDPTTATRTMITRTCLSSMIGVRTTPDIAFFSQGVYAWRLRDFVISQSRTGATSNKLGANCVTIGIVRLPYIDKRIAVGTAGQLNWNLQPLPSLESDPASDGFGCTAALFAYLTQVWLKVCVPVAPTAVQYRFGVVGDGIISMTSEQTGYQASAAAIEIVSLPDDIDMIFGEEPLIYPGSCGFAVQSVLDFSVQVGENRFQLGAAIGGAQYGQLQWINHMSSIFYPENPDMTSFWYHLKPGVVANITVYGTEVGYGAECLNGNVEQRYNPMAGGFNPYDGFPPDAQLYDGGGNPIT